MPHPRFKEILDRMNTIHEAKDHDYAGEVPFSNFRKSEKFGIPAWKAVLIRMSDKWSRLESLSNTTGMVKDESFDDTLIDLANYAVICLILREEDRIKQMHGKEQTMGDARDGRYTENHTLDVTFKGYKEKQESTIGDPRGDRGI